jgi:hypothetical protein
MARNERIRRTFTPQFKKDAVALLKQGRSASDSLAAWACVLASGGGHGLAAAFPVSATSAARRDRM